MDNKYIPLSEHSEKLVLQMLANKITNGNYEMEVSA